MVFDKQRHILDYQLAPARLDEDKAAQAKEMATAIARATNLAGILAVEMFITAQGQLLVNELAPRPHNSGHHTIEAAATSQYEQHLRAILDLPLGDTSIRHQSLMVNILEKHGGGKLDRDTIMQQILRMPGVHLHWYGKTHSKAGRKLGHVTITGQNMKTAITQAEQVRNILNS
jgi:5-(carboxyamino)imidazole ribonucleotide synthase